MKIYFLSSRLCSLTLNGVYFGITDRFERFADLDLRDRVFVQFSPQGAHPIGFFTTEALRTTPPEGCEVYLLKDGIAVYARDFPPIDFTLRPIAQAREQNCLATVFSQGPLQLSLESDEGFFIATLPPSFNPCKLTFHAGLCLLEGKNTFALYTKCGKCVLLEEFLDYSVENDELNATLPLSEQLGRIAKCRWKLSPDGCKQTSFSLQQTRSGNGDGDMESIAAELLPYAFFESVLIGAETRTFLSEALQSKADDLVDFLGDFIAVVPTNEAQVCGLVREKAERLYAVSYFRVELTDGKISDITEE